MKAIIVLLVSSSLFCLVVFSQNSKSISKSVNEKQNQQKMYFRGFGPCDLSKELSQSEQNELVELLQNDTSVNQIKSGFNNPGKKLAPLVKKLSEHSKSCIIKTAKFSPGPTKCTKN